MGLLPDAFLYTEAGGEVQIEPRVGQRIKLRENSELRGPRRGSNVWRERLRGFFYFLPGFHPSAEPLDADLVMIAHLGTEYELQVDERRTVVTLLAGGVELTDRFGKAWKLTNRFDQAIFETDKEPVITLRATNIVQWWLYYPGVIATNDLALDATQWQALGPSLEAYAAGDLHAALHEYPTDREPASDDERIYRAALRLVVGDSLGTRQWLDRLTAPSPLSNALETVIAAVTLQTPQTEPQPEKASEWLAYSYLLQGRHDLTNALNAATNAVARAPDFGYAHERVAELQFSHGRVREAKAALTNALTLSPCNAQAHALQGFIWAAESQIGKALGEFQKAIGLDPTLANGWLGRGLCRIRKNDVRGGLADLTTAAALDPNRAFLRSYLGKAFQLANETRRAFEELALAKRLDSADPTAWLYSALLNQQENRINEGITDLEKSVEKNENRSVYRSRLLLDQDQAVRGANLAGLYRDAGMTDWSVHEATRAVNNDYANYSAHLFLANSYDALRDPKQVNLRYETPWLNELLLANLLAPVGAGSLSQYISQQEYSRMFERDRSLGIFSRTEYTSNGDWLQAGSQYGTFGNTSYSVDTLYRSQRGQRPNNDLEDLTVWTKIKEQLTPQDSLFIQTIWYDYESGDVQQYYDPRQAHLGLRAKETQEPIFLAGFHHEWQPGQHTVFLASGWQDTLTENDPDQAVRLLGKNRNGTVVSVPVSSTGPLSPLDYRSKFTGYSAELQHFWQQEKHTLIVGSRYQSGDFDTLNRLGASSKIQLGTVTNTLVGSYQAKGATNDFSTEFQRVGAYAYGYLRPVEPLLLTVGVSYDRLRFPTNYRAPPISDGEQSTDQLSPAVGFIWSPFAATVVRGSYTRALGGVSFEQSFRLQPSQVAGFAQAYRSVIPESVAGSVAGETVETWGLAMEHKVASRTFVTLEVELIQSEVKQTVGVFDVALGGASVGSSTGQNLDYHERNLTATINHLLGEHWVLGARYRLTDSDLETTFPSIPTAVASWARTRQDSVLHQLSLSAQYNHSSGFFGGIEALWLRQSNHGYSAGRPGDEFWHLNTQVGYRFLRRRAEVKVEVLNLTGHDYRLNELNFYPELRRERTLMLSCKLNF